MLLLIYIQNVRYYFGSFYHQFILVIYSWTLLQQRYYTRQRGSCVNSLLTLYCWMSAVGQVWKWFYMKHVSSKEFTSLVRILNENVNSILQEQNEWITLEIFYRVPPLLEFLEMPWNLYNPNKTPWNLFEFWK